MSQAARYPQLYIMTCVKCGVRSSHSLGQQSSRGMIQMIWNYLQCNRCGHRTDPYRRELPPVIVDIDEAKTRYSSYKWSEK